MACRWQGRDRPTPDANQKACSHHPSAQRRRLGRRSLGMGHHAVGGELLYQCTAAPRRVLSFQQHSGRLPVQGTVRLDGPAFAGRECLSHVGLEVLASESAPSVHVVPRGAAGKSSGSVDHVRRSRHVAGEGGGPESVGWATRRETEQAGVAATVRRCAYMPPIATQTRTRGASPSRLAVATTA